MGAGHVNLGPGFVDEHEAQDLLFEIEDDGCRAADCREERMRTAVVTCCDTPPVLDLSEHAFDLVSLAIEGFAIGVFGLTPLTG